MTFQRRPLRSDGLRGWRVADDPEPPAFDDDGCWTGEFIAWVKRDAHRRAEWHRQMHESLTGGPAVTIGDAGAHGATRAAVGQGSACSGRDGL